MINIHLLELPLSRTSIHGSKGVQATEVRLYGGKYKPQKSLSFVEMKNMEPDISRENDDKSV